MKIGATAGLAFLILAGCASAPPAEEELNASPGAIASGMIGDANAEGVFEVFPAEHDIAVRHVQSGLVCRMPPDNGNRLLLEPTLPRGEDVACDTSNEREFLTFYVTRYPHPNPLAVEFEGAQAALRLHFAGARLYTPSGAALVPPAPLPANSTARYNVTLAGGRRAYSNVSVAIVGAWTLTMRYTVLAENDAAFRAADGVAMRTWWGTLGEFTAARPAT